MARFSCILSFILLCVLCDFSDGAIAHHRLLGENPDEVLNLPGLPSKPTFRQYSGYLNATNNRYLHYWFVESANDPTKDPLLLWLNGGPGCSSLEGFLGEHGPFHVIPGTNKLYLNKYSWNTVANVLYLEAPAGVGYSYSADKNYETDDDQVSLDNYVALQNFFSKYPQFRNNDFYVTGESYGGIYIPTLTARIFTGSFPINLKGFAVGNGLSSYPLNDNSVIFFLYHHGVFGQTLWQKVTKYCCNGIPSQATCNFHDNTNPDCIQAVGEVSNIVTSSGINPYDLYGPCLDTSSYRGSAARMQIEQKLLFKHYKFATNALKDDPPCANDGDLTAYLNQQNVRAALHIPPSVQSWTICSGPVSSTYKTIYTNMTAQYKLLLPKLRALVYNGDVDTMCNFLGDEWFVDSLNRKIISDYTYWKVGNQVGGFVKRFDRLDFVTIKGSGHMVPTNKPEEALHMITSFLLEKPY